jgi:uncharacterized NAD(P)/FAD-binding protein YdhS
MEPWRQRPAHKCNVAIIGGGFSGTTLAAQLLRHSGPSFSVVVIEKACLPGRGLAYGTESDSHLLNVPAKDMSAFPEDTGHFTRWAKLNFDRETQPGSFLPRRVYGRYLGDLLTDAVFPDQPPRLQWQRDEARAITSTGNGEIEIELQSGGRVLADKVVLALGNFPSSDPCLPGRNAAKRSHDLPEIYFANPWSNASFAGVNQLDNILLLGSGLTAIDAAVELRWRGFTGTIHFLSRHGLSPHSHQAHAVWPSFWNEHSPKSALGLLRLVRQQVREARRQGIDWRGVINSLRPVTAQVWQSLPEPEKRRFLRHLRPYWEVHRHRAAPEVAQLIVDEKSSRQIQLHAGRVTNYREDGRAVEITYRERRSGEERRVVVDRVINCTAPETDCRRLQDPLLSNLLARGKVRSDPLFLGLDVSAEGALINHKGAASESLYAVGPTRKGSLWESTAVPEIREQVRMLVEHLVNTTLASLGSSSSLVSTSADSGDNTNV